MVFGFFFFSSSLFFFFIFMLCLFFSSSWWLTRASVQDLAKLEGESFPRASAPGAFSLCVGPRLRLETGLPCDTSHLININEKRSEMVIRGTCPSMQEAKKR